MFDEPALLLERTIHNLEVLADLFSEEASDQRHSPIAARCRAAETAIKEALPALQAAGNDWRQQIGLPGRPGCIDCED